MSDADSFDTTEAILGALKQFPALAVLVGPLREVLASQPENLLEWYGVNAGTVLFRDGEPAEDVFVVLTGRLAVLADPAQPPVAFVNPGECVGEMALISHEARSAMVMAFRDSTLLRIPRSAAELLLRSSHEVAAFLLRLLASRLRSTTRHQQTPCGLSIALIPLAESGQETGAAEHLVGAFSSIFTAVRTITRADATDEVASLRAGGTADAVLVYRGDDAASGWTRHCIRQSDCVIFIAKADAAKSGQDIIDFAGQLNRAAELVVISPPDAVHPTGASAWLDTFPAARILHARVGNDDDFRRIARLACRRAIGLVLSGGGARAFAHIGALQALIEADIPIDVIAGNSMGSLVSALFALDYSPDRIAAILRRTFVETNPFGDYTVPVISLSRGRKMNRLLREYCGARTIENLWRSYFCVSANLSAGALHVHAQGSLWQALRASSAIPGIYPPWIEDGQVLVDGGVMNNFPTTVMREMRRGLVVGIDVAPEASFRASVTEIEEKSLPWLVMKGHREAPSMLRILARVALINGEAQTAASRAAADLLVHPAVSDIPILSFKAFDKAVEAGYRAAQEAAPALRRLVMDVAAGEASW